MKLDGFKIGFLGDSITAGVGTSNPQNNHEGYRYPDILAKKASAIAYNYGVSGTRIASQKNPIIDEPQAGHYSLRVDEMQPDLDVVIVFGGTNDFGHGDAPLGTFESSTEDTFYGALHVLINKLINKYPKSRIIFLTPLHRDNENHPINSFGLRRNPLKDYVNAIKEVCQYYALPVLDLYSLSGLQPSIQIIKELYMPDGLHPSDLGAERIADMLFNFLQNL